MTSIGCTIKTIYKSLNVNILISNPKRKKKKEKKKATEITKIQDLGPIYKSSITGVYKTNAD
jgi:hypothetical protein